MAFRSWQLEAREWVKNFLNPLRKVTIIRRLKAERKEQVGLGRAADAKVEEIIHKIRRGAYQTAEEATKDIQAYAKIQFEENALLTDMIAGFTLPIGHAMQRMRRLMKVANMLAHSDNVHVRTVGIEMQRSLREANLHLWRELNESVYTLNERRHQARRRA